MGWQRKRKPAKKLFSSPEKAKNGRSRRRILLSKADTGKTWRYGMGTERLDGTDSR